jgi:hypothetical protein
VKIASQQLPAFVPLNLWALRVRYDRFLRPFRFIDLQIPFPATPFFLHACKTLGGVTLCAPNSVPFCVELLCFEQIAHSLSLFALFFSLPRFVFNHLRALFAKHPGGGVLWTAENGCPPTISPQHLIAITAGPMTQPSKPLPKPSSLSLTRSSSILASPKWSIIPAPDSPARLRGRFA